MAGSELLSVSGLPRDRTALGRRYYWCVSTPLAGKHLIKVLIANPTARRIALRGAKKAVAAAQNVKAASVGSSATAGDAQKPSPAPQSGVEQGTNRVVASVAKPWAEKLAGSTAGRSILQALSTVSSEALSTAQPQSPAGSASPSPQRPAEAQQPKVKFVPPVPSASSDPPPRPSAMKWPPDPDEPDSGGSKNA